MKAEHFPTTVIFLLKKWSYFWVKRDNANGSVPLGQGTITVKYAILKTSCFCCWITRIRLVYNCLKVLCGALWGGGTKYANIFMYHFCLMVLLPVQTIQNKNSSVVLMLFCCCNACYFKWTTSKLNNADCFRRTSHSQCFHQVSLSCLYCHTS